jgi:hypothetical protein
MSTPTSSKPIIFVPNPNFPIPLAVFERPLAILIFIPLDPFRRHVRLAMKKDVFSMRR